MPRIERVLHSAVAGPPVHAALLRIFNAQRATFGRTGLRNAATILGVAPRIEIVLGDITEQHVDAVVNAANSSLLGGGGVDGAIHRKGGPAILEACKEVRRTRLPDGLPTGQAVATTAGELPARWVIHTVGPVYNRVDEPARLLAACHAEALRVADELGAKTVAFPAISTGVFGYPVEEAASVATNAVRAARTSVDEVRFVLFGDDAYDAFHRALGE